MSHIAFDLDALPLVPKVARSAGIGEAVVGWGLTQMWEWCWREKTDKVTTNHLRGFFGTELGAILVDFGFLEAIGASMWRVRGSARYLRITKAQSDSGKKHVGNLKRGTRGPGKDDPAWSRLPPGYLPAPAGGDPGNVPGSTATSDERLATSEKTTYVAAELSPLTVSAPDTPPEVWGAEEFWRWAQWKRQEAGFVVERKRPDNRKLSSWYSTALATLRGDVETLQEAFYRFGEDKHWQSATPPLPFMGFMSQWDRFVPRRASAEA